MSVSALLGAWEAERQPTPAVVRVTRANAGALAMHLGQTLDALDGAAVGRQDVIAWKDHLLETRAPRTVRTMLARVGAVFSLAVENSRLAVNPFVGVRVGRKPAPGRRGYSPEEAHQVLQAADREGGASLWICLLLWWTGARIGEIAHLKADDFRLDPTGGWVMEIRPNGERRLKTAGSERTVPLHRELTSRPDWSPSHIASLLAGLTVDPHGSKQPAASRLMTRLVELAGLPPDPRRVPAHSWRHSFKTRCREAGVEQEVHDALTGHAPMGVSGRYGGVTLAAMRRAIDCLVG